MEALPDRAEGALAQDLVDTVPLFDVEDLAETDEVLEGKDVLVPLG